MWNVASPQAKEDAGVLLKERSCECVFCLQPATIYSLQSVVIANILKLMERPATTHTSSQSSTMNNRMHRCNLYCTINFSAHDDIFVCVC